MRTLYWFWTCQQATGRLKLQALWKIGGALAVAFLLSFPLYGSFVSDVMLCAVNMPAAFENEEPVPPETPAPSVTLTTPGLIPDTRGAESERLAMTAYMPSLTQHPAEKRAGREGLTVTDTNKRLQFILLLGILLTIATIFISSFMPMASGAHAKAGVARSKREAAEMYARRIKKTREREVVMADLAAPVLTPKTPSNPTQPAAAPQPKKSATPAPQLESLEGLAELETLTGLDDADAQPVVEPGDMMPETAAVWPAPSLLMKKQIKRFFAQSHCQITDVTPTIMLIRAASLPYGEIPVAVVTKIALNDAVTQAVYADVMAHGRVARPKIIGVIVDEMPHHSARQRIRQLARQEHVALRLMSLQLMEKANRNDVCAQMMENMLNPALTEQNAYEAVGAVENPLECFGRDKMIAGLLDSMSHLQHIGLFGARKIGKTSLVWQLRERLAQQIVAYIDLQHTPRDCAYLYHAILDECAKDAAFKYPEIKLPAFERTPGGSAQFIQQLVRLWETLKAHRHDMKIALLLDEADHFVPNLLEDEAGFAGFHEFMGVIRGISQQYGFLVSMIVSSRPEISRIDTQRGQSNPGFHYYKEVFLSSLSENGCNQMIQSLGAQMGLTYSEEALSRIYYETGGHPYVTRQICGMLAQARENGEDEAALSGAMIGAQDVEQTIAEYLEQKSDYLESVWQRLSPQEQDILLTIATHHDSCSMEELMSPELGLEAKRQRRKAVSRLIEHELIEKCENKYSIRMGVLERFLQAGN